MTKTVCREERIRDMRWTINWLRDGLFTIADRCAALEEANANLRVERDAADVLLGEALDALSGRA
ncbi:MAG: hypothetical protein ACYDAE_28085 [Steroidobacteraceae bacterium]